MTDVEGEHSFSSRCRRFTIKIRSTHSRRAVPIHRSMSAFALGARTGERIDRALSERITSSKAAVNPLLRSWVAAAHSARAEAS